MANETFTVNETITLKPGADADGDGLIDPGEVVRTTVTITNNSTTPTPVDATGVQFQQILAGMTIFNQTGDDVNVSPIAYDDAYNVIGNTTFTVSAADGIFGGPTAMHGTASADMEFFSATIGANPATQTHLVTTGTIDTVGGTVFLNADGSFTYNPDAGFTGTDSFNYQLIDLGLDGVVGGGDDLTGTGTVTFTVEGTVWFIDNSAGVNGDGTQDSPFNSILNFNAVNDGIGVTHPAAGDNIYLREGTGTYSTADGITLLNNQVLTGQGQNLVINHSLQGNMTIETGSSGDTPVILVTGAGNQGIQLAQNNTIAGLDIGMSNATAVAIKDNGGTVGTLTISNLGIGVGGNNTGQALEIDNGGTINVVLESITSSGAAIAIDISGVAGTGNHLTVSGATTINDATSAGILIGTSTANATFTGAVTILNDAVGADGSGINITSSGSGTFAFSGGVNVTVNGSGVTALNLQTAGSVTIADVGTTQLISNAGTAIFVNPTALTATIDQVTSGGGTTGISLDGMSGSLTIASVSINGQTGDGIDVTNTAGSLTINGGTIGNTNDPGGIGVDVNGGAGNVTIGATINKTTAGDVIEVTGRSTGTVDFNGNITSNTAGGGIDINTNTGGTVRFDGGMTLSTGAVTAFNATVNTGMTLVVTDPSGATNNTLTTTSGIALNVANTTIGSEDLTFQSISAGTGAGSAGVGISLNTTGSLGGLTITGTGAAGSGGTIQHKTGSDGSTTGGIGIYLNDTAQVSLNNMQLNDFDNLGIFGTSVNGFRMTNSTIGGTIGTSTGSNDAVIAFGTTDPGGTNGFANNSTALLDNVNISGSIEHNVEVYQQSGTFHLTIQNSNIHDNSAATGSDGILIETSGTAHAIMRVADTIFDDNRSQAVQANALGSSHLELTLHSNDILTSTQGNEGFVLQNGASGDLTVAVTNNTFTGINGANIFVGNVVNNATSSAELNATISGNVMTLDGFAVNRTLIAFFSSTIGQQSLSKVTIDGNTINTISDPVNGIAEPLFVSTPDGSTDPIAHVSVLNNVVNITDPAQTALRGIAVQSTQDTSTLFLDIRGNDVNYSAGAGAGVNGIRVRQVAPATLSMEQGSSAGAPATVLAANNPLSTTEVVGTVTVVGNSTVIAPNSPATPTLPSFLTAVPPPAEEAASDGDGGKGDGTGGGFVPPTDDPAGDAAPPPQAHEVIVDDGVLSQAELDWFVGAALERWAATGLDAEQIAALEALSFGVADMSGLYLGSYQPGQVTLDDDGAGSGWYLDATPLDDAEYANGAGTRLTAAPGSAPTGLYDLLTTIMHEMGHALGLGDMHASEYRDDLMYSLLFSGERRLPGADQALDAVTGSITEEEFAGSPINVGPFLLPAGDSVTIQWDATVDSQTNQLIVNPQNTGTASATNGVGFPDQNSNTVTTTLDTLVLGGTIWLDNGAGGGTASDGIKNGGELGVDGVILTLFADTGSVVGAWDATDTQIGSPVTSAGGGNYSFTGLAPGEYIVRIDLDNFNAGGSSTALVNRVTTTGSADPDDNIDNDDNGAESGGEVFSQAITLAYNTEPDGTPGGPGDDDGDADDDTNFTLDFGFLTPDQQPSLTATAVNPTYSEDGAAVDIYSTVDASTVESLQTITSMTLTVTNVSDGAAEILTFDGSDLALTNGNFVFGTTTNNLDVFVTVSSGTATVSFSGASLTEAELETLVDSLAYRNTSQLPTDANRVVTITELVDSGSPTSPNDNTASLSVGSTVNVDPINDTPVVTVASPLDVVEQVAEAIAPTGTLSDADLDLKNSGNGNYDDAVLTVARNGGSTAQDLLTIANGAGFAVNGTNLETSPGGLVFATFSGGNGASLIITFTSSGAPATSALVDAVLQAVQYTHTGDTPPATIQLDVTLNDGAPANGQGSVAGNSATHTASITVNITNTVENDRPVVDLDTVDAGSNDDTNGYLENGAPSAVGTAVGVTDTENDNITGATITITDPESGDLLSVTGLPGGITVHGSSTATTLILTGTTTAADYAAALGQVGYSNTGNDPTDGGSNTNRLITVTVSDAFGTSLPRTMTMSIATDDDPSVAQDDDITTDEATPFSGSLFADNGHGADSDPDSTPAVATINGAAFTFGVQFALPSGALLTVNADGTFDYDPAGQFDPTPTPGSGASNQPESDDFTYQLVGGSAASVAITIDGVDTNDTLVGTAGDDTLDGGMGDDSYFVGNPGDEVIENSGGGNNDRVLASVSYVLGLAAEVEMLTTTDAGGTGAIDLTGSDTANFIFANAGDNRLFGRGDDDALIGLGGNDSLDGGAGNDATDGGLGDDFHFVDSALDMVFEATGEGNDRVLAAVSYALSAAAEVELLSTLDGAGTGAINLTGNGLADFLYGNAGVNVLSGLGGNDSLVGLGGNDILDGGAGTDASDGGLGDDLHFVDSALDVVLEEVGGGNDRVLASASHALAAAAEIELLSTTDGAGTGAIDLTGNGFDNFIYGNAGVNVLIGLGGHDSLAGLAGNDTLYGDAGDDVLNGGAGDDSMDGGAGNDFHLVDSASDVVIERIGEGTDRVLTTVSYSLTSAAEVELLSTTDATGTGAIDLTGSNTANFIYGNDGANTLSGLFGDDALVGLAGADILDGGAGNDAMDGGGGADTFRFTTALGAGNVDTILNFVALDDTIALDDAVFAALPTGALNANAFVIGTAAQDGDDRIIYDGATGTLYYDADGNGAGAQVQFATLQGAPVISASDFTVI